MCVIVHKPANLTLPATIVEEMYSRNSDGLGVMWVDPTKPGAVQIHRSLPKTAEAAAKTLAKLELHAVEAVIHFRFATHGKATLANTHPFEVAPGLVMCHNGVLDERGLKLACGKGTDTEAYIRQYIQPLLAHAADPLALIHDPIFQALVGEHIGHSKLVFMDGTGRTSIVNADLGGRIKIEGQTVWVSNTHWRGYSYYDLGSARLKGWDEKDYQWPEHHDLPALLPNEQFWEAVESYFLDSSLNMGAYLEDQDILDFFSEVGEYVAWEVLETARCGDISPMELTQIIQGTEAIPTDILSAVDEFFVEARVA